LLPSEEDESIISSWVADLPQQTQQMQEQEQQPFSLPPVAPPPDDDDRPINFQQCRTMVDVFFQQEYLATTRH
jgi:hypothetical protein